MFLYLGCSFVLSQRIAFYPECRENSSSGGGCKRKSSGILDKMRLDGAALAVAGRYGDLMAGFGVLVVRWPRCGDRRWRVAVASEAVGCALGMAGKIGRAHV